MTDHSVRPPIPATCEQRPTIGGLVIPWINVQLADGGVDFRSQHNSRAQRCLLESLCQVCGTVIARPPYVLIGGPGQLARLQFDEPPLHPECAAYVSSACPMVAGRMKQLADRDPISEGHRGAVCPDPDCDCGGWIPNPDAARVPNGRPAHDWYAVYARTYAVGATSDGRAHSAILSRDQVLAVRHHLHTGRGAHLETGLPRRGGALMPQRIQRKRTAGWRMPAGAVYVGRPGPWGNPFGYRDDCTGLVRYRPTMPTEFEYEGRISAHGMRHDYYGPDGTVTEYHVRWATRSEIVELFRRTVIDPDRGMRGSYPSADGRFVRFTADDVRRHLRGRDLACWCPLDRPCHADVLLEIANGGS